MAGFDIGNSMLLLRIKRITESGVYPGSGEVIAMRLSLIEDGPPPLNVRQYIEGYKTPIEKTDIATELPPGYPSALPRPYYLPDGRIVLKPVPVPYEISNNDIAWIMVALQNAINTYSRHPYTINWEVPGKGSGFGHIYQTCKADTNPVNFAMWKFYDYSSPPDVGGDPLGQQILGSILSFIPGGSLIGNTLNVLGNMIQGGPTTTNLPPPAPGKGSESVTTGGSSETTDPGRKPVNWLLTAGIALALLIATYDSD